MLSAGLQFAAAAPSRSLPLALWQTDLERESHPVRKHDFDPHLDHNDPPFPLQRKARSCRASSNEARGTRCRTCSSTFYGKG